MMYRVRHNLQSINQSSPFPHQHGGTKCLNRAGRRRDHYSTRLGHYRVNEVVGRGGFGQAARCTRIADNEALKETTLLEHLSHPNIVGLWESLFHGPSEGLLCIVMDYAEGGDLGDYLMKQNGRLLDDELSLTGTLFRDWLMTSTLRYIHEKNILHRDLKPMNVFLTGSGTIKLGDFGIAKVLECAADTASTRCGTLVYMAPEVMGVEPYGHKADMWSLGTLFRPPRRCVLYEMTPLRRPFTSVAEILQEHPEPIPARCNT
ncbi:conserved unknown protein [Ectocarpus siliculosus]|uniref:non-specific serine/threonine protein kinase n=1 Tax=Ectocarpus siliculosus TaxID=2880 RepID=D8LHM2_ECTSI|nr:conserved unknown protein [Ectocarpus siliculosus]|eukprot:CBN79304.1 conserved unknown protein [Ectocarpus siliculosus]